jgi:hypothetical protein
MYEKIMKKVISSVFTDSIKSPCRAPAEVKNRLTATMNSVRRNKSMFTFE